MFWPDDLATSVSQLTASLPILLDGLHFFKILPSFLKSFAQEVHLAWNILFPTNFSYDPLGRDITYVRNPSSNRASVVSTVDVYLLSCCEIIVP